MSSDPQFVAAPAMDSAMDPQLPTIDGADQGRQTGVTVRAERTASHPTLALAGTHASGQPKHIPKVNNLSEDREESRTLTTPTSLTDGLLSNDVKRRLATRRP